MQKSKIQGILPLTFMQQALLFHSLSMENNDQGFLHVQCLLKGKLDIERFQEAWNKVFIRHEVFRTSVHWEKLEKPLQVIHPKVSLPVAFKDWSHFSDEEQKNQLNQFKEIDRALGLDLTKAPVSRLTLIKINPEEHLLIWACHHILLDGWSSTNIIKDVFSYYEAEVSGEKLHLDPIPSFKSYLKEIQSRDKNALENFWKKYFDGFTKPSLLSNGSAGDHKKLDYQLSSQLIGKDESEKLRSIFRSNRLTVNTFVQGVWSLLLSRYSDQQDVAFGTTASVRSAHLANADLMAGLFTNMLPVRIKMNPEQGFIEWLTSIQNEQGQARNHQQVTLNEIISWASLPTHTLVFDHLLVVENFPWKAFTKGGVTVAEFGSGITTTYPMTVVVNPIEDIEFIFQYDPNQISDLSVSWLESNLMRIVEKIIASPEQSVKNILSNLEPSIQEDTPHFSNELKTETPSARNCEAKDIIRPNSPLELQLTSIWEEIFGTSEIGVTDNFFELGGKSLMAVRLFSQIEKQLGFKLSPISLLRNPSIRDIAKLIDKGEGDKPWKSLIPIQSKGREKPLFCLHAKGGYVFFYNNLAPYLGEDQPLYALQPRGLDGKEPVYDSIEEMAAHYISEMKSVQPQGPYSILGTCLSNAVGLEIAQQIKKGGEEVAFLGMVDASPGGVSEEEMESKKSLLNRVKYELKNKSISTTAKKIRQKIFPKKSIAKGDPKILKDDILSEVQRKLSAIFFKYKRSAYDGKVTLIRSGQFNEKENKNFHVDDWKSLVTKEENLEVVVVPGAHRKMFLEPEVGIFANKLKDCLNRRT